MRHHVLVSAFVALCPLLAQAADNSPDVKVSSIGYLPGRVKRASITASATAFTVKRDADGSVAYTGNVGAAKTDPDTSQSIAIADFTSLSEVGKFYVDVTGVGRSVTFPIGNDVYRDAFVATMLGYYGWRCNTAVSFTFGGQTFAHDACHMDDAYLDYIGTKGTKTDGKKGWHDAGDYGKYTVNAGITLGSLLAAWEEYSPVISTYSWPIPEDGGALPDYLAEIRWELEWVLKMQYSDGTGRVSHKLTSLTFDAPYDGGGTAIDHWVMPEGDAQARYFVPWGSAATADFVAMLAKASRIYQPYDPAFAKQCLDAAKVSYTQLTGTTANQTVTDPTSTGAYTTTDSDDRLWAAAEMWEATGDAAALSDFETRAAKFNTVTTTYVDSDFDWSNVKNLGMYVYLQSKQTGRNSTTVTAIQKALMTAADTLVTNRNNSGYGRALSGKAGQYYWGSNGAVARTCMLLQLAYRLSSPQKADYLDTCVDQISWIFGRNYYNRSQVTGIGLNPPMHPHHRPSQSDGIANPWPGLLVGGGNSTSTQAGTNKNGATNWIDDVNDYELNEVAINWNAPLTYALASFLDANTGSAAKLDAAVTPSSGGAGGNAGGGGTSGSSTNANGGAGGSGNGGASGSSGSGGRASGGSGTSANGGSGGGAGGVAGVGAGGSINGGKGGNASGGAGGSAGGGASGGSVGNGSTGGASGGGASGAAGTTSGGSSGSVGSGNGGAGAVTTATGAKSGCSCALAGATSDHRSPVIFPVLFFVAVLLRACRRPQ